MEDEMKTTTVLVVWAMLVATPAMAQNFIGAKKIPGDPYVSSGCGSSWEICQQRRAARANSNQAHRANPNQAHNTSGNVPRFCYSITTGKFTHWGPCRVVELPDGRRVKVAN